MGVALWSQGPLDDYRICFKGRGRTLSACGARSIFGGDAPRLWWRWGPEFIANSTTNGVFGGALDIGKPWRRRFYRRASVIGVTIFDPRREVAHEGVFDASPNSPTGWRIAVLIARRDRLTLENSSSDWGSARSYASSGNSPRRDRPSHRTACGQAHSRSARGSRRADCCMCPCRRGRSRRPRRTHKHACSRLRRRLRDQ